MSMERWYTIRQLSDLTGRKPNSIRRHLIPQWEDEGIARKRVNGEWEANQDALFDIRARQSDREEMENRKLMAEERAARIRQQPTPELIEIAASASVESVASQPVEPDEVNPEHVRVIEKIIGRIMESGQQSAIDEMGRQTIHIDPRAKSVRIVLPTDTSGSFLFDLVPRSLPPG
jgi:hypothetical protein